MHAAVTDTSLAAYRRIQRTKAAAVREQVLEYIRQHPMCTADAIQLHFAKSALEFECQIKKYKHFLAALKIAETARKRIPELIGPNVGDVKVVLFDGVRRYRVREVAE